MPSAADAAAAAAAMPSGPPGDQSAQNQNPGGDTNVVMTPTTSNPEAEEAARLQAEEDAQRRTDNPNTAVGRAANPDFAGESFSYGGKPADAPDAGTKPAV